MRISVLVAPLAFGAAAMAFGGAPQARSTDTRSGPALHCAKAVSRAEKLICGRADLRAADASLNKAYADLLRQAPDKEIADALRMSQRRWLKARDEEFSTPVQDADDSALDERARLLDMIGNRAGALSQRVPVDKAKGGARVPYMLAALAQQRKDAATTTGGAHAGFDTSCFFAPPGFGDGEYICLGSQSYQNKDRICTIETDWASGHSTEYRTVSRVVNGRARPVAKCAIGYASTQFPCSDDFEADDQSKARWDRQVKQATGNGGAAPRAALLKLDPDAPNASPQDTPWLKACLGDPNYPATPKG